MKFIKVLPDGLIDRIAAGEVIESPASVVKELLENSLDSSAKNIEISIRGGGKDEILIVDDGEGIPKDQVEIAFMRHATSKIKSWDDLLRTGSLGFRGEALPSISSVSILELTTHYDGEPAGSLIKFEGGKQSRFGPAPPRKGCSISVRNLFYNVPARRKFLKSESSEKRKISETIRRYLIAHPDTRFTISYDGKPAGSHLSTDSLLKRLESVWGANIAKDLLKIETEPTGPVNVYGYISRPEFTRGNRSEIFFFVNKRPVLEKAMFGAVSAAYSNRLDPGKFPYIALFLDIEPTFVDVNVHPAKTEVRFSDGRFVFNTLKEAMEKTLSVPTGLALDTITRKKTVSFEKARRELFDQKPYRQAPRQPAMHKSINIVSGKPEELAADPRNIGSVIQMFQTYIIISDGSELVILDQHTAHERVLFEKTLNSLRNQNALTQKLLFEGRVKLTPEEVQLIDEISELLNLAGLEIRQFSIDEVIVSGLPQELSGMDPTKALKDLLSDFSSYRREGREVRSALAAAVACRGAVKAGQSLSEPQMKGLYADLLRCEEPYRCPHGRPTMAILSHDDLERIFKRK